MNGGTQEPGDSPEAKAETMRAMFASIAHRYDLVNSVLSLNQDRYWRASAAAACGLKPGGRALDVACGTGRLTLELARLVGREGRVVGLDFCPEMLARARENLERAPLGEMVELVAGEVTDLPFPDSSFDAVAVGFALRTVPDLERTIAEMARVVRTGGRVVSLELAKPELPVLKQAHSLYLRRVVPLVGRLGVGFAGPYDFLSMSLEHFPPRDHVRELFVRQGLVDVQYTELTGGIVTVHSGTKPQPS
jgi:demethylmenaquinone methyltransferase/2-methoxy-6-polyprenyl-1,4-benzoquinol methylase